MKSGALLYVKLLSGRDGELNGLIVLYKKVPGECVQPPVASNKWPTIRRSAVKRKGTKNLIIKPRTWNKSINKLLQYQINKYSS